MNNKWSKIASTWSMFVELQAQQSKLFQNLINFLMEEESECPTNGASAASDGENPNLKD